MKPAAENQANNGNELTSIGRLGDRYGLRRYQWVLILLVCSGWAGSVVFLPATIAASFDPSMCPDHVGPARSADKPTSAQVVDKMGMPLVYQDTWDVSVPSEPRQNLWGCKPGLRNAQVADPAKEVEIFSFPTKWLGDKPARRVLEITQPAMSWWGWENTQFWDTPKRRIGIAVDIFVPSTYTFVTKNNPAGANGKSHIGGTIGPAEINRPGGKWPLCEGGSTLVAQQSCANFGLNMNIKNGRWHFKHYAHWLRQHGIIRDEVIHRAVGFTGEPSPPLSHDRWHTIEMFVQMDTNGRDGELHAYVDGEAWNGSILKGLDWGASKGWGIRGLMGRHMPGGWNGRDTRSQRDKWWSDQTNRLYMYNWRVYAD